MTINQGWEFPLSLFCSSLFCSKSPLKKSNPEQIALVTLYKRVTRANCSLRKSDGSDSLVLFRANRTFALLLSLIKIRCFHNVFGSFHCFSHFYAQKQIAISLFHSQKRTKNQRENSQPCNLLLFRAEFAHALLSITQSIEQL